MVDRPSFLSRFFGSMRPKDLPPKRKSRQPPKALAQRTRALTIDEHDSSVAPTSSGIASTSDNSVNLTINDQAESPLFRLPLELRLQIYNYILGNRIIHLGLETQDEKRLSPYLRHFYCKTGHDLFIVQPSHSCWTPKGGRPKDPEERMLSMLKVCRKIYSEAIHLLYSTNTFQVIDRDTFIWLPTLILPKRLHTVRKLVLVLNFSTFPPCDHQEAADEYITVWQALTEMSGLQEVHVHVMTRDVDELTWMKDEALRQEWVNRVKPLTEQLQTFKVFLPLNERICGLMEDGPFTIWKEPAKSSSG